MSKASAQTRVLVTSAGTGASNNLIRSLRADLPSIFIAGAGHDRFILHKSSADRKFLTSRLNADSYAKELSTIAKRENIDLIIPTSDEDAAALSDIRSNLEGLVCLPDAITISLCQDKYALTSRLQGLGVAVPLTHPVCDRESVDALFTNWPQEIYWCRPRRGCGAAAATMVHNADQAWSWIAYWNELRGIPVTDFTICEYLPGRDYNVQSIWKNGRLVLMKMCERLSYLGASMSPSGMTSTPALARTVRVEEALDACCKAIPAMDAAATGVFSVDLKENKDGVPHITEINAGRFCMITNIHDLTGSHSMAGTFVSLALDRPLSGESIIEVPDNYYLIREIDCLPEIIQADTLFKGVHDVVQ